MRSENAFYAKSSCSLKATVTPCAYLQACQDMAWKPRWICYNTGPGLSSSSVVLTRPFETLNEFAVICAEAENNMRTLISTITKTAWRHLTTLGHWIKYRKNFKRGREEWSTPRRRFRSPARYVGGGNSIW
jgi:hypothetical protein